MPLRRRRLGTASAVLVATAFVYACGDDGTAGVADSGIDGAAPDDAGGPAAPAAPAMPVLTPCPDGWREIDAGDYATCEPWPERGPSDCGAGEAHFPGEPGCRTVGAACPAGDFPEGLPPEARVLYVRAGSTGGEGTIAAPYGRIYDAMVRATGGTFIALAKGTYSELVEIRPGVTIVGACAAETVLRTSLASGAGDALITARGRDTALRSVTIGASARRGILALGDVSMSLDGVILDAVTDVGVLVATGAHVSARDLVVRDVVDLPGNGSAGVGAVDATLDVDGLSIERAAEVGLIVSGPGVSHVTRAAVRDTQPDAAGANGLGVGLEAGSTLELTSAVLEHQRVMSVYAVGGSSLVARDIVIRDTLPAALGGTDGTGLTVSDASATVERVLLERDRMVALWAAGSSTFVTTRDVVVRDVLPRQSDDAGGIGVQIFRGASADLSRVVVERARLSGILLDGVGTARLEDATVRDIQSQASDGFAGAGLRVQDGGDVTVRRAVIERIAGVGLRADGFEDVGPSLTLEDIALRDIFREEMVPQLGRGRGVDLVYGSRATLARVVVERTSESGIVVAGASADGTAASATMADVVVRDVAAYDCSEAPGCAGAFAGHGLSVLSGGTAVVSDFHLAEAALCGVIIASGGSVDLHRGEVVGNAVGACVPVEGYDIGRLMDEVAYRDNGSNLQAEAMPLPNIDLQPTGTP